MNYTYDELRGRISILEIALSHGYCMDRSKGVKWPVLKHPSGDKVIIINPRQPHNQGYFNPQDDRDKGTLIQFVDRRLGWLFPMIPGASKTENINRILHQWLNEPFVDRSQDTKHRYVTGHDEHTERVRFNASQLAPLQDASWLLSRGIRRQTLQSPSFAQKILQCSMGSMTNVAFPYQQELDGEIVGAEIRNYSFKGHMTGSQRGNSLWISRHAENSRRLVVCESALDALSHFEMNGDGKDVYVSFGGHLAKGQIKCLKDLYDRLTADRDMELVIGVDYDEKGHFYAGMLLREFPLADRIFPNGKDFNDDLMKLRESARRIR
jgi:hypothetical protein